MKRIYLQKITQHGTEYYLGKADPRELVRVATKIEVSTTQEAQRPLSGKRVKDIASFVEDEGGILPNTLVIAVNDSSKLKVKSCTVNDDTAATIPLYYLEFPVTDEEFSSCANCIDVMDGQHRLYSFAEQYRTLSDAASYEIGFTLFVTPTLDEQRRIFMVCNEKQEKVSGNLLMWFKEKLDMLAGSEKEFFPLVTKLNEENVSPLQGRIIMGGETIKNGIKAQQLIRVLDKAKIKNLNIDGAFLDDNQRLKVIALYLQGWESTCKFNLKTPDNKIDGAACKIAGIRYMLLLLPTFWERSLSTKTLFTQDYVAETLKQFISSKGIEFEDFFTCDANRASFRSESATFEFAEQSIIEIKAMNSGSFNPLA